MQITSSDFQEMEELPARFSRDGEDINPSLTFSEIPPETQSLALTVEDPDAPGRLFTHWILYNMTPATLQIVEGQLPFSGQQGTSDYGEVTYGGPKPPSGTHRYQFKLFALDEMLEFEEDEGVTNDILYKAMEGHVIDQAQITATYRAKEKE
jgi:Raf kinase inhibitor-like YbhB/YbcL family protein